MTDTIDALNDDLVLRIFSFFRKRTRLHNLVDATSVYSGLQVCKLWKRHFESVEFWKGEWQAHVTDRCMLSVVDYQSQLPCLLGCVNMGKQLANVSRSKTWCYSLRTRCTFTYFEMEIKKLSSCKHRNRHSWVQCYNDSDYQEMYCLQFGASAIAEKLLGKEKNPSLSIPIMITALDLSHNHMHQSSTPSHHGILYTSGYASMKRSLNNDVLRFPYRFSSVKAVLKKAYSKSSYFKAIERKTPPCTYVSIGARNRAKIADYVVQTFEVLDLDHSYSEDLAMEYFTVLCYSGRLQSTELQMAAAACVWLSTRVVRQGVNMSDLVRSADNTFQESDLEQSVALLLQVLRFHLVQVTFWDHYMVLIQHINSDPGLLIRIDTIHHMVLCIEPVQFFRSSIIASSVFFLGHLWRLGPNLEPHTVEEIIGCSLGDIRDCIMFLSHSLMELINENMDCIPTIQHEFLRRNDVDDFVSVLSIEVFDQIMQRHHRP
jgi:hypothetical protein